MFDFCVRNAYNSTARKVLGLDPYPLTNARIGIITKEQINKLVNLNLLDRFCFKIPYSFKEGDYFTVLPDLGFDLAPFTNMSRNNVRIKDIVGKVFKVDRIKSNGVLVFSDSFKAHGFYANWIRHSTQEEIQRYKDANDILNFW